MDATTGIALVGAGTGSLALLWQGYTYLRGTWTLLSIRTRRTAVGPDDDEPFLDVIQVTIINRSRFPVTVRWVRMEQGKGPQLRVQLPLGATAADRSPGTIAPFGAATVEFDWEDAYLQLELERPVRIRLHLDTQSEKVFDRYV